MVGRILASQRCLSVQSPEPFTGLPYMNKKDFVDVIKLIVLTWGDYPRLSGGSNVIISILREKRETGESD